MLEGGMGNCRLHLESKACQDRQKVDEQKAIAYVRKKCKGYRNKLQVSARKRKEIRVVEIRGRLEGES